MATGPVAMHSVQLAKPDRLSGARWLMVDRVVSFVGVTNARFSLVET